MLSIEDAFKAAFRAGEDFYLLQREATGEVVAKYESRLRSAIRAYGWAVLEEAWDTARDEYSGNPHPDGTDALAELRAEIEALG